MGRSKPIVSRTEVRGQRFILSVALLVLALGAPAMLSAQHEHPEVAGATVTPEVPLMKAVLGPFTRPITTKSAAAQAYFDQGMQMVYAFTYPVAIRSFQEAQRQDPTCAMCFWGEALARGPWLNSGMTSANSQPAHAAAAKAVALAGATNATERALIEAIAVRYTETHDAATRPVLDSAYSRAMAHAYELAPRDLDVGTLYAESIMLLDPVRANYRLSNPFVQSFHRVLEGVLAQDIRHPGACHLYVHGTEATEDPGKAEACADLLGSSIPGASHINHMPSHTYNRLGRWAAGVRSNLDAWHSDQRAEFGEGVSYAGTHNLHMLFFAAAMDGQGSVAASAAREYAKQVNGGVFYHTMTLLRFGKFEDILAITETPEQPLQRGLWDFSRGYAHLRAGAADSAAFYLARVDEGAATIPETVVMRGHTATQLLNITGNILRGEILRGEGKLDQAIAVFETAVTQHDGLRYDEPEPLSFSARHWLGAALLEANRHADAEAVYRHSLVQHPHNGWSLFGLEQAVRAQGRTAEADAVREEYKEAWARADTMIRASRF